MKKVVLLTGLAFWLAGCSGPRPQPSASASSAAVSTGGAAPLAGSRCSENAASKSIGGCTPAAGGGGLGAGAAGRVPPP